MPFIDQRNNEANVAAIIDGDLLAGLNLDDILSTSFKSGTILGGFGKDEISVDFDTIAQEETSTLWTLLGEAGNDTISIDANIVYEVDADPDPGALKSTSYVDAGSGNDTIDINIDLEVGRDQFKTIDRADITSFVDGGLGNDTIMLVLKADAYPSFGAPARVNQRIVDLSGNNNVSVSSGAASLDGTISVNNEVTLGAGDDHLTILSGTSGDNFSGEVDSVINLGDGNNTLEMSSTTGTENTFVQGGSGSDIIDYSLTAFEGNDEGARGFIEVDTLEGEDEVNIDLRNFFVYYIDFEIAVSLGSDNDTLNVNFDGRDRHGGPFATSLIIDTGTGNDEFTLQSTTTSIAPFETIQISGGAGADLISVNRVSFLREEYSPPVTLTITDFSIEEGDELRLPSIVLPTSTGAIASATDLNDLISGGGDVISFEQVGDDAVLTLFVGQGTSTVEGHIVFQGLNLSDYENPTERHSVRLDFEQGTDNRPTIDIYVDEAFLSTQSARYLQQNLDIEDAGVLISTFNSESYEELDLSLQQTGLGVRTTPSDTNVSRKTIEGGETAQITLGEDGPLSTADTLNLVLEAVTGTGSVNVDFKRDGVVVDSQLFSPTTQISFQNGTDFDTIELSADGTLAFRIAELTLAGGMSSPADTTSSLVSYSTGARIIETTVSDPDTNAVEASYSDSFRYQEDTIELEETGLSISAFSALTGQESISFSGGGMSVRSDDDDAGDFAGRKLLESDETLVFDLETSGGFANASDFLVSGSRASGFGQLEATFFKDNVLVATERYDATGDVLLGQTTGQDFDRLELTPTGDLSLAIDQFEFERFDLA